MKEEHERVGVTGTYHITHKGPDGEVKSHDTITNVVVDDGVARLADLSLSDVGGAAFDSSSGGTMLSRSTNISRAVQSGDSLDPTFELTIS